MLNWCIIIVVITQLDIMHNKVHLPKKVCPVCKLPFTWRKKWAKNWNEVKYCSKKCSKIAKVNKPLQSD